MSTTRTRSRRSLAGTAALVVIAGAMLHAEAPAQGPPVCQQGDVLHFSVNSQEFTLCGPSVQTLEQFVPPCAAGEIMVSQGAGTWSCALPSVVLGGVACDVDQDGALDAADVTTCRRTLAGLPSG